ncbi:MAG: Autotransporter adhesin [uncultured Sulfurovum sp.]|uniref:Autotransporter adhesin n=1 Tax=uncultured Sulfurovum sp. TaxID=269237 RepID=A0A6S6TAC2_9BACT|nr:MAG: Autotransporter adhesin [uncultured Sulfurovum sp.]
MKKTILVSLVVSSFLMGENTVNNLNINQTSEITAGSSIDNAMVHQGKTEVLGASDVDEVIITQVGNSAGNIIEGTDVVGSASDSPIIHQGFTKIDNSEAKDLDIDSTNIIKDVGTIYGKNTIEQGSFIISDSNATDSLAAGTELDAFNTIDNTSIDASAVDINGTLIKQSVIHLYNGAITDNLSLEYKSTMKNSSVEDTEIFQGTLDVNSSELSDLQVRDTSANDKAIQLIEDSDIVGGSIHQNSINISNNAYVSTLNSFTQNTIDETTSTDSTISQSEITIN